MYVAMCFGTDLRKKPKWRIENMNEMTNERELDTELNMQELLQTYLRRWKLIVLCMIVGIFAALGITAFCITPM